MKEQAMLTVNDLMTILPSTVTPDASLRTILGIMKSGGFRQIPVLDEGRLVGIISDRDIRLVMSSPVVNFEHAVDETTLLNARAESCMTPAPISVTPTTPAYKAAEMLSLYKFGALPVVEGDMLVGIITVTDFLDHCAGRLKNEWNDSDQAVP
jgi:acetoin utilization protein AcuB